MVSWFWWYKQTEKLNDNFEQFIEKCRCGIYDFPTDYERYTIDGKIVVDYIGKYETLLENFENVCHKLGIPFDGNLTREKGDTRIDKSPYNKYYNEINKKIIESVFHKEISLLCYQF